jgi:hypothetical protein
LRDRRLRHGRLIVTTVATVTAVLMAFVEQMLCPPIMVVLAAIAMFSRHGIGAIQPSNRTAFVLVQV